MNISVLPAASNLNYFAIKIIQMNLPVARAVTRTLNEYSPPLLPFLKVVKVHLQKLVGVPLVVHAPPPVAAPVKYSSTI